MNRPSALAISATAAWSAARPNRSTGITTFGVSPAAFAATTAPAMPLTSILNVVASTSMNTGVAPTRAATSAVAQNVNDGQSTPSPAPTPNPPTTSTNASVPLAQVITCLAPQNVASLVSNVPTSGPRTNWQWLRTRATAASIAIPRRRRCAPTSINGIDGGLALRFIKPSG